MLIVILISIAIVCVLFVLLFNTGENKKNKAAREAGVSAYKMKIQKQREIYQVKFDELKQQFGECSVDVVLGYFSNYDTEKHLYVFKERKILVLQNEPISFDEILGFELKDNQSTITKTSSPKYITSTCTGSMVGRAIVGGILSGGVGAVLGAATAKKTTEVVEVGKSKTITRHNYRILLTIDDISNPVRIIEFGNYEDIAEKVANVLNVILQRNQGNVPDTHSTIGV